MFSLKTVANSNTRKIICIVGNDISNPQIPDGNFCSTKETQVFRFTDAINALEHFKINRKDYSIMISDFRMPVINGVQLLKTVKDLNPSTRTVLATDFQYDTKLIKDYTKKQIINGLLQKPVEPNELIIELNRQINISD